MRAFLVEDNPAVRQHLAATLQDLCPINTVGEVDTEEAAVRWLAQGDLHWDLAIIDLFLKDGSGLGVLEACRYRHPEQKVVVLSNHVTAEIRWRCAQLGADKVFDKTTELDDMVRYCVALAKNLDDALAVPRQLVSS
jgi:two-component system, OmpR family, response regulator